MIGTTRGPNPSSRNTLRRRRANAPVVDAATFAEVPSRQFLVGVVVRQCHGLRVGPFALGRLPAQSSRRHSIRYSYSGEPTPGRT